MVGFLPAGGSTSIDGVRWGKTRKSMDTNLLLHKAELGKVKKCTFQNPPDDHVFGMPRIPDAEGAREVSMIWREHQPNAEHRPGPDFRAMNKLAAMNGLTDARQQPAFRRSHTVTLKTGHAVKKSAPLLPSDRNEEFVYGKPGTHKTHEEIQWAGKDNPHMKHLIQGAYTWEWIRMNEARAEEFDTKRLYIAPKATKATNGHTYGALLHLSPNKPSDSFKIKRFTHHAHTKVDDHWHGPWPAREAIKHGSRHAHNQETAIIDPHSHAPNQETSLVDPKQDSVPPQQVEAAALPDVRA